MASPESSSERPLEGRELFAGGFLSASDFASVDGEEQVETIGPYEVVRRLGQGGMGSVFLVRDPDTSRTFALKVLSSEARRSSGYARFFREAQVLAKIQHRNVVRVHRLEESDAGTYMVQEFVEGRSLKDLTADGPLDPSEAARLVRDLAEAVAAVHAAGILHRDLKPDNVVVQDGIPVLLDFGVARDSDADTLTQSGAVLGTPAYMAPEQVAHGASKADGRADVYGLGAVFYTLLTGAVPFAGGMVQVLNAVIHHDPIWPRERVPSVPTDLDAVCRRAMAKAPADRYGDVGQLQADLERFLRGEPVAARRPRATPAAAAAAAALVVLLVLLAAAWTLAGPDTVPDAPDDATPAEATLPAPLWTCADGDVVAFRTVYHEREGPMTYGLEVEFRATVRLQGELLRFDTEVEGMRGVFEPSPGTEVGAEVGTLGVRYDSRDPPGPNHPLANMGRAIGMRYAFSVDPRTGAVIRVEGMQPIADAVDELQGEDNPFLQASVYRGLCRAAFNDDHIRQVYATLFAVRGPERALDWQGDDGAYVLRRTVREVPALRPLAPARRVRARDRWAAHGSARYADGRLRSSRVEQQLVGGENTVRWEYHAR